MSEIYTFVGSKVLPSLEVTMALYNCDSDNEAYGLLKAEFEKQKIKVAELIKPRAVYALGKLKRAGVNSDLTPDRDVIYSILTLGEKITEYIDECMKQDMVTGMLLNFMADSCVFTFSNNVSNEIKRFCKSMGVGIYRAYEAPDFIPMECQQDAFKILDAGNTLGVGITEGYMLSPLKSLGRIYSISDNSNEFNIDHDCNNCSVAECSLKNILIM